MPFDEFLAERVQRVLAENKTSYELKKMMGGLIFMVNDKMCVGVDKDRKTLEDRLMVRVGKLNYDDLLQEQGCRVMDFTGKEMKGFIFVYAQGIDTEEQLSFWIERALAFNEQLA
ncbi:MAG: TfoX/Sxy family protein [Cyclobacteriaceae bacterium]